MKKILLLASLLAFASLSAQDVKITGFVKDSLGNALEMANVIAYTKANNAMAGYSITNDKGKYQINVASNAIYQLKVSFIGLSTEPKMVDVKEVDLTVDFIMTEKSNALDEVEVVYEMPVTVKGDTLVYNADSFTNGTEKKLEDVLKKLPGVEINDDGEIEVEGKTVSKILVEGKEFFDGDTKLATKNIPADALSKIEVLKNYDEVAQMQGLRDSQDNVAINIRLKEGKKNFWFGDITVGAGLEERYLVKPKLFYYSPDYSINIITDLNNIGEVPFTRRDYFNFTGGFRNFGRGGTSFNVSSNDLGFTTTQNNRANEIETKFGAINASVKVNDNLDISGFGIFNDTKTDLITNSTTTSIGTIEETFNNSLQRTKLGLLKFGAVFKPNTDFRLDYDIFGKLSKQEEDGNFLSVRNTISENIDENLASTPFSIQQSANAYYTLNEKNVFSLEASHLLQDDDPFYNAIRDEVPFRGVFTEIVDRNDASQDVYDPLFEANRYNINQSKKVKTSKFDAKLDYYYVINKKSNLNFTFGSTLSHQEFNSDIFQILDNEQINSFTPDEFNNEVTYNFNDLYAGIHYKVVAGIFTFNPGLTFHNYQLKETQLGTTFKQNESLLLPDANLRIQLKKSENIQLNYAITANYTDINNLAEGYVFNNYRSLSQGNRNLENAFYDSYSANYFSFNMFNYTNIFARINYSVRRNAIKNTSTIEGIERVASPINSNLEDQVFTAFGNFTRTFGKIKATARANFNWSSFNNILNFGGVESPSESESVSQTYSVEVNTNFKKGPNFDLGYSYAISDYNTNGVASSFYTNRPYVKLDWLLGKSVILKSDYSYYNYSNDVSTLNEYGFMNAELFYQKEESKWEYKLGVTNLLDTQAINRDSFNEFSSSTSSYFVQPRYVFLSLKYNL
jgi:hypothetical protein